MLQSSGCPRGCTKPDDFSSSDANSHERQNGKSRSVPTTQPTRRSRDRCYRTRSFQVVALPCQPGSQHSKSFRYWNNIRPSSQAREQNRNPYHTCGFCGAMGHFDPTQSWLQNAACHIVLAMLQSQLCYRASYYISPAMLQSQLYTSRLRQPSLGEQAAQHVELVAVSLCRGV